MRLAARLVVGLLLPVLLLGAALAWEMALVNRLQRNNQRLVQVTLNAGRLLTASRQDLVRLDEFTRKFLVLRDPGYAAELDRLRSELQLRLAELRRLPLDTSGDPAEGRFEEALGQYSRLADRLDERVLAGEQISTDDRIALQEAFDATAAALNELEVTLRQAIDAQLVESSQRAERARRFAVIAAGGAAVAALLAALIIGQGVARGVGRLARGTRELARGNFDHRVQEAGGEELASLARDFNSMALQLSELDRLKRDFVSSVSHDLKAPLASMQETTRLLLEGTVGDLNDKQERLLRLTLASNERLSAMIGDLLDLARLEAGAMEFETEPLDLTRVSQRTLEEATTLLESRQLRIDFASSGPALIEADPQWLARALWNLISNAAKFSPVGSRLEIRVDSGNSGSLAGAPQRLHGQLPTLYARFAISDSGPGIPDQEKERIFERFQRSNKVRRDGSGTGLGLAITREVAERQGGAVWAEDAPGGGSLFVLVLPLSERRPVQDL